MYGYTRVPASATWSRSYGGPSLPWWLWAVLAVAVVGLLGYRHIDLSSKVLGVLLIAEVGIVLLLDAFVVGQGGGPEGLSTAAFSAVGDPLRLPRASALMFAIAGLHRLRGDRDLPRRGPRPRAAPSRGPPTLALLLIGGFYALSAGRSSAPGATRPPSTRRLAEPGRHDHRDRRAATSARSPATSCRCCFVTSLFACVAVLPQRALPLLLRPRATPASCRPPAAAATPGTPRRTSPRSCRPSRAGAADGDLRGRRAGPGARGLHLVGRGRHGRHRRADDADLPRRPGVLPPHSRDPRAWQP